MPGVEQLPGNPELEGLVRGSPEGAQRDPLAGASWPARRWKAVFATLKGKVIEAVLCVATRAAGFMI